MKFVNLFILNLFFSLAHAENIDLGKLENLHQVDSNLYRSEQPQTNDFKELERLGIKTVINLRNRFRDERELKKTRLKEVYIPISSWKIDYLNLIGVLKVIDVSEKPVLVHCLHGADRTGCVVACYRIVFSNWSKEEALAEFLKPEFGFHDGWFPRMRELLESIDVEVLRKDVLN